MRIISLVIAFAVMTAFAGTHPVVEKVVKADTLIKLDTTISYDTIRTTKTFKDSTIAVLVSSVVDTLKGMKIKIPVTKATVQKPATVTPKVVDTTRPAPKPAIKK